MKLTLPQQDVYFEQLLYPEEPVCNIGASISIEGVLNVSILEKAYQHLIRQHDTYRTRYYMQNDTLAIRITGEFLVPLPIQDFSMYADADVRAVAFMQATFVQPFEMTSGDLLHRFILVKVSPMKHYLFSVYHHLITDGWGASLMFQRLVQNYNELIQYGAIQTQYPYTYQDFMDNDTAYQASAQYTADLDYWKTRFESLPSQLFEKKVTKGYACQSERQPLYIKRAMYDQLGEVAREFGVSTFHLILGALYVYMGRVYQQNDMVIGLPVLNRGTAALKKTVGLFMGVTPLRMQLDMETSFQELLLAIKNQLRKDYRHQRFPIGKLIQELTGFQEKGQLFHITVSYEKQNYAAHFQDTNTTVTPLSHKSERVALAIYVREFDDTKDVTIDFDYNLGYFDQAQMSRMVGHFEQLLYSILAQPHQQLVAFNYLAALEKKQLLTTFNTTGIKVDRSKTTLLTAFKETALLYPTKTAVSDAQTILSYKALDQVSDTIAQHLIGLQDAPPAIGVLLERTVYTLATLLGIMKAGKSYIPLDPTFPHNRLQYIITHSELQYVISDQKKTNMFSNCEVVPLAKLLTPIADQAQMLLPVVSPTTTAYIIYTSGSTGNPKGVAIGHRSLINFLKSMCVVPGIGHTDVLFAVTTYSFDISVLEFFAPLVVGASVYVAANATLSSHTQTMDTIAEVAPTLLQATPSFFQLLFNGGWQGDKRLKILCGGDVLSQDLAANLLSNCAAVWNMYGPTETTIWSSLKKINHAKEATIIGTPIANTQLYVLDAQLQLVPIGAKGTLYIGGDGLAQGYVGDPIRTAQKFIKNPHGSGLIYNTNDLVQWNSAGELVFLGRNDHQVKIRGYRIELGDIETKLDQIQQIRKAVVVSKKQQGQAAFLVAYIQKEVASYEIEESGAILREELPSYMIPSTWVAIDAFPLTPNKKIDRKTLADSALPIHHTDSEPTHPSTAVQQQLVELWKAALDYNGAIGIHDHFFALGGHSLNAVKLAHNITTQYGCAIALRDIFEYPTIAAFSQFLETQPQQQHSTIPQAAVQTVYPITSAQYQLWMAAQQPERSIAYNMVAVFELEGSLDTNRLQQSMQELLLKHEVLRTNFFSQQGNVVQKIRTAEEVVFAMDTVTTPTAIATHSVIEEYIHTPFDLESDVLLRILLVHNSESRRTTLVFCTHHIIIDGMSLVFLTQELINTYQGVSSSNTDMPLQFKDYAVYMDALETDEVAIAFYTKLLAGYKPKQSIVVDPITTTSATMTGQHSTMVLDAVQTAALKQLAIVHQSTPYSVVVTLLNILIYTLSGHKDIVLGTVHSGRNSSDIAHMIGMFASTLPLRIQLDESRSFVTVLAQVQQQLVQLATYQELPVAIAQQALFDILVTYQNPDFAYQEGIRMGDVQLQYQPMDTQYSRVPLLCNFFEANGLLQLTTSYDTRLYQESTITMLHTVFLHLLETVTKESDMPVVKLKTHILESEQEEALAIDFNF